MNNAAQITSVTVRRGMALLLLLLAPLVAWVILILTQLRLEIKWTASVTAEAAGRAFLDIEGNNHPAAAPAFDPTIMQLYTPAVIYLIPTLIAIMVAFKSTKPWLGWTALALGYFPLLLIPFTFLA